MGLIPMAQVTFALYATESVDRSTCTAQSLGNAREAMGQIRDRVRELTYMSAIGQVWLIVGIRNVTGGKRERRGE